MNPRIAFALSAATSALFLVGCIHHHETVYRDQPRTSIRFENDKAARIFYQALSERDNWKDPSESNTEVKLPLVLDIEHKEVAGPNTAFNRAVATCDSNQDGLITEEEAQAFAGRRRR